MLKNFVLRSVTMPGKLMMACPKATALSLCIGLSTFVLTGGVMIGLWTFLIMQGFMIYMTEKDPYFINVRLALIKCRKTRNYVHAKGNRYDS